MNRTTTYNQNISVAEMANPQVPDHIKSDIRSVLLSKVGGVKLGDFTKDYRTLVQEPIRFRTYGFKSLIDMMSAIPDVCR